MKISDKVVEIYTDGACSGNPGPGGWAALLRWGTQEKMVSGAERHTTNNRMELMATIKALRELKRPCNVMIMTDSEYVRKGITEWLSNWKKKNWRGASNQPIKNQDLWEELDQETQIHKITWRWVKGHSGHPENDRVDKAAREAITLFLKQEKS